MCTGDTSCPLPGVLDVNIKCVGTITGNGFSLTRLGTDVDVRVSPHFTFGTNPNIQNLNCHTEVGNAHGPDILDRVLVQILPNGHFGDVQFQVFHPSRPPSSPYTFSVTTSSSQSSVDRNNQIASGFNSLPISLNAVVHPGSDAAGSSAASETLNLDYFVEVRNARAQGVTKMRSVGQSGMIITWETGDSDSPHAPIPTLNSRGIVVVVILMLISGLWLLRRRVPHT